MQSTIFVSTRQTSTTLSAEILLALTEGWSDYCEENVNIEKENYRAVFIFCSFLEE